MAQQPLVGQSLLTVEVSRSYSDTPHSVGQDLYLTTHNTHNRQTSMPPVGFEPAIPGSERLQTHPLDRAASGFVHTHTHTVRCWYRDELRRLSRYSNYSTDCTTEVSWFDCLLHNIQTRSEVRPVAYPSGTGVPSLGIRQPDREAGHSVPSTSNLPMSVARSVCLSVCLVAQLHSVSMGGCLGPTARLAILENGVRTPAGATDPFSTMGAGVPFPGGIKRPERECCY